MKRIEKEIKKNSSKLIESSLPEIDSLDSIHIEAKQRKSFKYPLFAVPLAASALLVAALLIPLAVKANNPKPIESTSRIPSNTGAVPPSQSDIEPHIPSQNVDVSINYTFYDLTNGYKPSFNDFSEVAYYSYLARGNNPYRNQNRKLPNSKNRLESTNAMAMATSDVDEYGRTHYRIDTEGPFQFSQFLFFEFDSVNNAFLDEKIGNGHINALAVKTNIFDEEMIVLKNGDKYFSCLTNGGGTDYIEFSAHKTIEGFDLVKTPYQKRYTILYFRGNSIAQSGREALTEVVIEGQSISIDPTTIFYDPSATAFYLSDFREFFGLSPEFEVVSQFDKEDSILYDASVSENTSFLMDEFQGTFSVNQNNLYLDEDKILNFEEATKLYASDINKDGYREIVYETKNGTEHKFVIYDIKHSRYLHNDYVSSLGIRHYDFALDYKDNELIVKMLEPGMTDDVYMMDYGHFGYKGDGTIGVEWENIYDIYYNQSGLKIVDVFEADGETPVLTGDGHYLFNSNTSYIVQIALNRYPWSELGEFPGEYHPIRYTPFYPVYMSNLTIGWEFISYEDEVYTYQVVFPEQGFSYYHLELWCSSVELKAAIDSDFEPDPVIEEQPETQEETDE